MNAFRVLTLQSALLLLAPGWAIADGPFISRSVKNDVSPRALRDLKVEPAKGPVQEQEEEVPEFVLGEVESLWLPSDPVLQDFAAIGGTSMPTPDVTFDGVSNDDNRAILRLSTTPGDPNGDVGPDHYVQTVNRLFGVFDKTGTPLVDFMPLTALWSGFGGLCESLSSGDPIVLYDHLADRWLISRYTGSSAPFHQCIAISTTGDPRGEWFRYDFVVSTSRFNDYPKFGVWPDGYYLSAGARGCPGQAWAFERDQMLAGQPARMVTFVGLASVGYVGLMPADLDGPPPPEGTPNYFVGVKSSSPQAIYLFQFHVDWANPENSTFGVDGQPNARLTEIAPFSTLCLATRSCVPQPDTSVGLDALSGRLVMYRAQYRNFDSYETVVFNHTVDAGSQRAGVRWYEIRDPSLEPYILQQGTYAPDDGIHRWMGSAAMDANGNLAVGYSASSSTIYPSIYYAGRQGTDPLGILAQGEAILQVGSGSQTSTGNRWGDYSMMAIDPIDDCTFWYTAGYVAVTGTTPWRTRVGSFKFPDCVTKKGSRLNGSVSDAVSRAPITGGLVQLSGGYSRALDASGYYSFDRLPAGTYVLSVTAAGYESKAITVTLPNSSLTVDFSVSPLPSLNRPRHPNLAKGARPDAP